MSITPLNESYEPDNDLENRLIELYHMARRLHAHDHSPIGGSDPVVSWSQEAFKTGALTVGTGALPPGIRVPWACTLTSIVTRTGINPAGQALKLNITRITGLAFGGTAPVVKSVTHPASAARQVVNLRIDLAEGDVLNANITQVGSTVAGSNLAVQFVAVDNPAPLLVEHFTPLTSGTAITYANSGQTWEGTGNWVRIDDGYARAFSAANSVLRVDAGEADITTTVGLAVAGADPGLVFRYTDDSNYWFVSKTELVKRVAGVNTVVATLTTPVGAGDSWTVSTSGNDINVLRNSESVALATDSFNATATYVGLRANNDADSRFDYITADVI